MIPSANTRQTTLKPMLTYVAIGAGTAFLLIIACIDCSMIISRSDLGFGGMVILPISTVTIAGAVGGLAFYAMRSLRSTGTAQKWIVNLFCTLVYIVLLWLALVAALSVTGHWD